MTDTATTPAETGAGDGKRQFSVQYTLEIIGDELPPSGKGGGGGGQGRESVLEKQLEAVKANTEAHGKWVAIGKYKNPTAAGAAANVLRQRHGRSANVDGFEFAYRKVDSTNPETGQTEKVAALLTKFTPDSIVPGAKEEHERAEAARLAHLAQLRAEREKQNTTANPDPASNEAAPNRPEDIASAKERVKKAAAKSA